MSLPLTPFSKADSRAAVSWRSPVNFENLIFGIKDMYETIPNSWWGGGGMGILIKIGGS